MHMKTKIAVSAIFALTASYAVAAPCSMGTAKAKDPTPQHVNPKSSDVDREAKNLAGGAQPASPGTVGAMNNAGANQKLGDKKDPNAKIDQGNGVGTSSKNLVGDQQPAYPKTVGAMNNTGSNQMLGRAGQGDDGC